MAAYMGSTSSSGAAAAGASAKTWVVCWRNCSFQRVIWVVPNW